LMQEAGGPPVKTYTIGFDDSEFNEARHAADVARHLGTEHTELLLTGQDARAVVPRMAEIFDEPFADPSQLPTLLVSQLARRDVTVALCGDGGDELFAGYNRYLYGAGVLSRVSRIPGPIRRLVGAGIGRVPPPAWDRAQRMTAALLPGVSHQRFGERVHKLGSLLAAPSVGEMYCSLLSACHHPAELLSGGAAGDNVASDMNRQLLGAAEPRNLLDRMMLADQLTYLPDDLLAKVDRASMAVSLEVRAPLLDHRIAEFSWRLPRSLKVRGSLGKWILRQVLYRRVPPALIDRPKMGFSVPIANWLRGPLRAWADDLLRDRGNRADLLDMDAVGRLWDGFQRGRRSAAAALWAVLMFQSWRARWQT